MQNFLTKLWNDESGQDLVEYALLVAFIAIVAVAGVILLGDSISDLFSRTSEALDDVTTELPAGGT